MIEKKQPIVSIRNGCKMAPMDYQLEAALQRLSLTEEIQVHKITYKCRKGDIHTVPFPNMDFPSNLATLISMIECYASLKDLMQLQVILKPSERNSFLVISKGGFQRSLRLLQSFLSIALTDDQIIPDLIGFSLVGGHEEECNLFAFYEGPYTPKREEKIALLAHIVS